MSRTTSHRFFFQDASRMGPIADGSVNLVVTSPPYPMIEMWDDAFVAMNPEIGKALESGDGFLAFSLMHGELEKVWQELDRVTARGGMVCINIGDAVRTVDGTFRLYPSHATIARRFLEKRWDVLPAVIWRKTTNAPNKFMGSGMMPPGAYVTLEHEFILLFRKGGMRTFPRPQDKALRRESAFFWEERNTWFSDVWFDIRGTRQELRHPGGRERSAAFPFEVAFRLISMFSVKGDLVLDPFAGTGTTAQAAAAAARNSASFEIDPRFESILAAKMKDAKEVSDAWIADRLAAHRAFVERRRADGLALKHLNRPYGFPVVTKQETELFFDPILSVRRSAHGAFDFTYAVAPGGAARGAHLD